MFDVVLQTQGNGITIGNPGQAEVIIVDDDDGEFILYSAETNSNSYHLNSSELDYSLSLYFSV